MEFLFGFNEFNSNLILEHFYDSVVNQYLGLPVRKESQLPKLIEYIDQMIVEKQVKNIVIKSSDSIEFTIRGRKYFIKPGILTLFKTRSIESEIKNLDVLEWIFGNKPEALDSLKTLYSNRVRTINKFDIDELRILNDKIGKRSQEDFNNTFKTPKKSERKEIKVDVPINKDISLNIYNKVFIYSI
jgi:hypothetical protein